MHRVNASGAAIPAIGLGTWTLRGEECSRMVERAIETGYRHLDTAAMYGNEEAVGRGLRRSGIGRGEVFVTTKVWWTDLKPADLRRSAEQSLDRLGVDHVDLLLIHWPNPQIPLPETMAELNAVRSDGLTRHIGVSNFPSGLLAEARAASAGPLVADQVEYHPYLDQSKLLSACRAAGMALISYCPLHRGGGLFQEEAVRNAATRHGRSPGQIILRWHVQQENVVAIPRTSRPERLAENLAIFDFQLSKSEMDAISALGARMSRLCDMGFTPEWDAA